MPERKPLIFILIIMILSLVLQASFVAAATPIRYFSFENFAVVTADVGITKDITSQTEYQLVGSAVISYSAGKAGRLVIQGTVVDNYLTYSTTACYYAVISTNAGEVHQTSATCSSLGSGDTFTITVTKAFQGGSIQVDLYFKAGTFSADHDYWTVRFDWVRAYFLNDDHQGIISTLTDYTQVDGVLGQALKLDSTEILMNQVNLTSGTITFSVKWDGAQTTILKYQSDAVLWIDANGYVNIKDENGTVFTSNITLEQGVWQDITVAFQAGTLSGGYIAIDSNETAISWTGNFVADRVGDSAQSTSTLIDELNIYNEYMDLEQARYGITTYVLKRAEGSTITIYPEGSEELGNITVTFLDGVGNVLGTAYLQESSPEADIPANTSKISLSRGNVERIYLLENISSSNLAFPGLGELAVKVITAYVYPATYNTLEIKTLDGKVVFRDHIGDRVSFTALYGAYYVFTVEGSEGTFSIVAQATDNLALNFPDPEDAFNYEVAGERLIANKEGDDIVITYIGNSTVDGTVTIIGRDKLGRIVQNVTLSFSGSVYNAKFPASSNVSYYVVSVETSTGFKASKVVATSLSMKFLIIDKIFPQGIRLMFFGFLGLFLVKRKHKELGPLLSFIVLSIMALLEWVTLPVFLATQLAILASLALFFKAKEEGWVQ